MPLQRSNSLHSSDKTSSKKLRNMKHSLVRNRKTTLSSEKESMQSQPTIANFMSVIGETSEQSLTSRNMVKFMDRDILRLSSKWSRAVSQNELVDIGAEDVYGFERTLSSECAKLEVEAIASMASLTSSLDGSKRFVEVNESWDEFDTDEMDEEEQRLDIFADFLRDDFQRLGVNAPNDMNLRS